VDNLTLSLTWYCKKVFSNSSLEQIEFGFSTGDEKFSDAYFFISPFPDGQALKKLIPDEKKYRFTKDKSEMILPYSEVSKAKNGEQTLLNFYGSILK